MKFSKLYEKRFNNKREAMDFFNHLKTWKGIGNRYCGWDCNLNCYRVEYNFFRNI